MNIMAVWWKLTTIIGGLMARTAGVACSGRQRYLGLPIFERPAGAKITLGPRVVLVSNSRGTALGVRSRTTLRCLTPDAVISIGEDTGISGAIICAAKSVEIGKRCLLGADVMMFDTDFHNRGADNRRYSQPDWARISKPIVIGDDVFLGTRSTILKGVTIGNGSIVAAASVVTKDVPPGVVVAGNPARIVGEV